MNRWRYPAGAALFFAGMLERMLPLGIVLVAFQSLPAQASTLINFDDPVDMVYDSSRGQLYISRDDSIYRYAMNSGEFLAPISVGGALGHMAISPDGNTLLVADRSYSETEAWLRVIDLNTSHSDKVSFERVNHFWNGSPYISGFDAGVYSVAFGNDGRALFTTDYDGSGWSILRSYDLETNEFEHITAGFDGLQIVRGNTKLTPSADGSRIGFAEGNISDGRFGVYDVQTESVVHRTGYDDGTSWYNYEIGVSRDGSQIALPTYGGTFVYDENFNLIKTIGEYAGEQPIGIAYHPLEDSVFFAFAETTMVRRYSTENFSLLGEYDFEYEFDHPGTHSFREGYLRISDEGDYLFAKVEDGIRFQELTSANIIPEPASMALFSIGALGIIARRRLRK